MTLSQIVDIYLHLCHNDSVDEPEPLYLTLSTRSTLLAEVSNLAMAANEGKGISHIHSWDEYGNQEEEEEEEKEEAGDDPGAADNGDFQEKQAEVSDDLPANAVSEPPVQSEEGQDEVVPANHEHEDYVADRALDKGAKPDGSHVEHTNGAETNQEVVEDEESSHEQDNSPASAAEANADDGHAENFDRASQEDIQDNQQTEQALSTTDLPAEGPYDSEEQTESTATLGHAPVTQSDEQQPGQVTDLSSGRDHLTPDYDGHEGDAGENFVDGDEDDAGEDNFEDQNVEGEEEYYGGEEEEEEEQEENQEEEQEEEEVADEGEEAAENPEDFGPQGGIPSDSGDLQADATLSHHETPSDSGPDHSTDHQSLNAMPDPYDGTEGEKQLPVDHVDHPGETARKTPELADDLLGVDEGLFASPEKGPKSADSTFAGQADNDTGDPGEDRDSAQDNAHSMHQSGDDFEELGFDDEDYFELDDTEHPADESGELGSDKLHVHGSGRGKRSREADDELDFAETPTPDAKRSRSS